MVSKSAYTVQQLARLAGISVRTLHHYDQIGLLRPASRTEAGYRMYSQPELWRLQQILLFKELDLPLEAIRTILDQPGFDPIEALQKHRNALQQRAKRIESLLLTIEKTIQHLEENTMPLTDSELYEGFSQEQIERYTREAREMYNPVLMAESQRRLRKLSKAEWQRVKEEGSTAIQSLAALTDRPADDPTVQAAVARHHAWIENFYPANAETYRGLGELYATHAEFRAFHEQVKPGLADFMRQAMDYYAAHSLK
jgi:DNA-binding transcriptional MerR regulator